MAQQLLKKPKDKVTVVWEPQPRQALLISCPVFETLFGGARGGGKSDGVLGEFAAHADQYGVNAIGLCVRRERTQLQELIERSRIIYTAIGAKFNEVDKMWRFPNGARLRFAYLENDNDALSYQGHSYTRVYVEEMGTFPNPDPIFKLMATLSRNPDVPSRFIATANPGGPGHLWIKQRYIDPAPLGMKVLPTEFTNPFTGEVIKKERVFIPSRVTDNKFTNTATYIGNLYMSGSAELVKAWLLGDWNVMLGAFFPEFSMEKHVLKTFPVPKNWTRFMSFDWGSARPFSVGWWTVVPDAVDFGHDTRPRAWLDDKVLNLPKGAIIRYKEWYGAKKDNNGLTVPNVGLKLTAEEIAEGIYLRERDEPRNERNRAKIVYRTADPSTFKEDGGPSHAERMGAYPYYIQLQRADNSRVAKNGAMGGWDALRQRLKGEDGKPMIYFMDCCVDAIRTLPALQHADLKPEDVDTTGEDHAPDEIRYACMSRPYSRPTENYAFREYIKKRDNTSGIILYDDLSLIGMEDKFNDQRIN
jgi:hypothetical protein